MAKQAVGQQVPDRRFIHRTARRVEDVNAVGGQALHGLIREARHPFDGLPEEGLGRPGPEEEPGERILSAIVRHHRIACPVLSEGTLPNTRPL